MVNVPAARRERSGLPPISKVWIGVVVVWSHHVGIITGQAPDGQWIVHSGNAETIGRAVG